MTPRVVVVKNVNDSQSVAILKVVFQDAKNIKSIHMIQQVKGIQHHDLTQ